MKIITSKKILLNLSALLAITVMNAGAQTLMTGMPSPNGSVYAFEKAGNTIYIGGQFSQVNSVAHGSLAKFDAVTGVLDSWSPYINNNHVSCLAKAGNKLIAGGSFTEMNGQPRYGICMFDLATGNLESWFDTANYASWRMGIGTYNNYFYYSRMPGSSWDTRIVCVDATTGAFTPWQSDSLFYGDVNAIYASGTFVYVGGQFTFSGGSSVYDNLCRFDQATGALDLSWHPEPAINNFGITAIVESNSEIFIGGDFNIIAGQSRKGVAGFDMSGNLTGFNQNSSSYEVMSLFADGEFIWVGGNSSTLGSQLRYRIAQIRISNGLATCWDATATSNTWSTVQAMLVSGDTVYAGPFGSPSLSVFNQSPLPLQASAISGADTVLPFSSITYTVPFVAGHSYTWNITGGAGTSITNSIQVTWGAGPLGTVSVLQNNPTGSNCANDTSLQVFISSSVGITNPEAKNITVFPNPTSGAITISNPSGNEIRATVYDVIGNEILKAKGLGEQIKLDLDSKPGFYFLKIESAEGFFIEKLLKN